jgi:SHS2 domain-containing protein
VGYTFLDDAPPADVGFEADGATRDECFRAAADATLETMLANPDSLQRRQRREAHVEHEEIELALVRFLEEMIYHKDADQLLLRATDVRVRRDGEGQPWKIDATFEGEQIDPSRHELANDVKAVTVHRLKVERRGDRWRATVVLDV